MRLHANARLSLKGRPLLVERVLVEGWSGRQVLDRLVERDSWERGRFRGRSMTAYERCLSINLPRPPLGTYSSFQGNGRT
jgi:hypothetical protein